LCSRCVSLAGLVLSFIACFILPVIAPVVPRTKPGRCAPHTSAVRNPHNVRLPSLLVLVLVQKKGNPCHSYILHCCRRRRVTMIEQRYRPAFGVGHFDSIGVGDGVGWEGTCPPPLKKNEKSIFRQLSCKMRAFLIFSYIYLHAKMFCPKVD